MELVLELGTDSIVTNGCELSIVEEFEFGNVGGFFLKYSSIFFDMIPKFKYA